MNEGRVVLTLAFAPSEQGTFHHMWSSQVPDKQGTQFLALPCDSPASFTLQIGDQCRVVTVSAVQVGAHAVQEVM